MIRTTVKIDGMMCGMCEAHISDTIRKAFPEAKKVAASHKKGEATFLTKTAPDEEKLKTSIAETGYTMISCSSQEYVKKGLFARG
ncbi:MAG: heavy-metal-associated domain-containing protein [Clostridiales bacterium]|nr:heavy-metal-associated domain-containing protein [Clostridiales bacterium]